MIDCYLLIWWRHGMEKFSTLLAGVVTVEHTIWLSVIWDSMPLMWRHHKDFWEYLRASPVPSDATWRQRSGSTLVQVMACCLRQKAITWTNVDLTSMKSPCVPSISLQGDIYRSTKDIYPKGMFGIYTFEIIATSPRGHRVNRIQPRLIHCSALNRPGTTFTNID